MPWAQAIVHLGKDVENRPWRTHYRGRILIQASLKIEREEALKLKLDPDELPTGAIVGSVEIVDCIRNSKSKSAAQAEEPRAPRASWAPAVIGALVMLAGVANIVAAVRPELLTLCALALFYNLIALLQLIWKTRSINPAVVSASPRASATCMVLVTP